MVCAREKSVTMSTRITRVKRMEVAILYLLGNNYREIEKETRVSHGSIVNIVKELEEGELDIEGVTLEQVQDLRQLALELKSKGLKPAQAMNGIRFYMRLVEMQITPELIECWSNVAREISNAGFQMRDFIAVAQRLRKLEMSRGETIEEIVEKYQEYAGETARLREEISALEQTKVALCDSVEKLSKESDRLKKQKEILASQVEMEASKLEDLKVNLAEVVQQKSALQKQISELQRRRTKVSSEINGREEVLRQLDEIGFSNEDLLRLKGFLEGINKGGGRTISKVKEDFFSALVSYKDTLGLNKKHDLELQRVEDLRKQKSMLSGSIAQLENSKARLVGEIESSVADTMGKIKKFGEESAVHLEQHLGVMQKQLATLLADVLATGEAVGGMRHAAKQGELSHKHLRDFISEVKNRL
jgi:chromosome segregation ATPase